MQSASMLPPNPRLQRTGLRSPRSRQPLGRLPFIRLARVVAFVVMSAAGATACVLPADAARERAVMRAVYPSAGLLVFKAGEAERLRRSDSFTVTVSDWAGDAGQIERALIREIGRQAPAWRYTSSQEEADVSIRYESGFSVCVDCEDSKVMPQWAVVEVVVHHGLARAEWTDYTSWWSRTRLVRRFVTSLVKAKNERAA
jgi:hypothetical protein